VTKRQKKLRLTLTFASKLGPTRMEHLF